MTLARLLAWTDARFPTLPRVLAVEVLTLDRPGWLVRVVTVAHRPADAGPAAIGPAETGAANTEAHVLTRDWRERDDGLTLERTLDGWQVTCGPLSLVEAVARLLDAAGVPLLPAIPGEGPLYLRSPLAGLAAWFAWRCDGDWEWDAGVTLDGSGEAGWRLTVDVAGTPLGLMAEDVQRHLAPGQQLTPAQFHAACPSAELARTLAVFGWLARGDWQDETMARP